MRKLPEMLAALVFFAVSIQVGISAIQPYLGWIGRTFAIVVIIAMLGGLVAVVIAVLRHVRNRSDEGDTFNG